MSVITFVFAAAGNHCRHAGGCEHRHWLGYAENLALRWQSRAGVLGRSVMWGAALYFDHTHPGIIAQITHANLGDSLQVLVLIVAFCCCPSNRWQSMMALSLALDVHLPLCLSVAERKQFNAMLHSTPRDLLQSCEADHPAFLSISELPACAQHHKPVACLLVSLHFNVLYRTDSYHFVLHKGLRHSPRYAALWFDSSGAVAVSQTLLLL